MIVQKSILRVFGLLGVVVFGAGFYFTYGVPGWVEEVGKDYIKDRLQAETLEKIDAVSESKSADVIGRIASKLLRKTEADIENVKAGLKNHAYEKAASVIAEMRNLDCECRQKYAQLIKANMLINLASLESAKLIITDFMKSKYMDIVDKLSKDLRIFTGSNFLIFLFLLLISFLKPQSIVHLFLPGTLLFTSSIICSYFYLFEQNWFFTIIYNDFLGYGYLAYVGILFLFLCDIAFNKGKVTSEILNAILNAVGSVTSVSPC